MKNQNEDHFTKNPVPKSPDRSRASPRAFTRDQSFEHHTTSWAQLKPAVENQAWSKDYDERNPGAREFIPECNGQCTKKQKGENAPFSPQKLRRIALKWFHWWSEGHRQTNAALWWNAL